MEGLLVIETRCAGCGREYRFPALRGRWGPTPCPYCRARHALDYELQLYWPLVPAELQEARRAQPC